MSNIIFTFTDKYKNGLVPELCNLRRPNPEGINIFNTL